MRYCEYCGAELPANARFCGMCGRIPTSLPQSMDGRINPVLLNPPLPVTPPLFNSPSYPSHPPIEVGYIPPGQPENDVTIKKTWPEGEEFNQQTWQDRDQQSDEYRKVWPDVIAPLAGGGLGQFPASNAPVVPGSPHIGGVPSVQGSPQVGNGPGAQAPPHMAGNAPPLHELAHQPPSSAPPPQHSWTWEHHTTPPHHQQHPPLHHPQHSAPPEQHPPAKKWYRRHRHERAEHPHTQTHHPRRFHLGRAHHTGVATTSKVATGVATKWAIILLAAVVVMASGGIIFVLASTPTLALNGSSSVSAGGTLQLHGRGFVPGGTITLTVDNGLPATLAVSRPGQSASMGDRAGAANLAGMLNTSQARYSNGNIIVGLTGTFDASVVAQSSWPAGRNVLHARENSGSRSADLAFTILAQPAHMAVNPSTLDFGDISQGSKVAESVLIGNTGGSSLLWSATTDGSPWLTLQSSSGILRPGAAQNALYALVDTSTLKQGTFTAEIRIHSNGGDVRMAVQMRVGPPVATRQAQLNVNPSQLNFGQLPPGQQVTNTLTIGNQGTQALQWQLSSSGNNWLSLSLSSGNVQPGGLPQNIQVTVDTNSRSLQAGSNSASITIHSNGGNTVIPVTLTLLTGNTPTLTPSSSPSPTLSPSPTTILSPSPTLSPTSIPSPSPTLSPSPSPTLSPSPSPTLPPSPSPTPTQVIQVTPGSLGPTSSGCAQNSDGTYTCAVTVSESTPGNLGWFAPTGIGGANITFSPPNGQFSPSLTSQQVTIASIPCANSSFTFLDQNNNSATVNWSCQQSTPSPTPSLTPTSPPVSLGSGTWQDSSGGSSYVGDAVTMQLTVQGNTFSGTLTGTTGASTPVQGQDGTLSSFSPNDQQYLNFVMQNYGNQTGIFLAFSNTSDFEGAYAGCKYYGVLEQNGNIEGLWYFPNNSVDTGSIHMNKVS